MAYEKLIGAIVAILFGLVPIIFCKKIAKALVSSEHEFWKNMGIKTNAGEGYLTFAKYFILFIGITLVISGIIMFFQFFRALK